MLFTTTNRSVGRFLAVCTALSMILSFVPVFPQVANAATDIDLQLFAVPNPTGDDELGEYVKISNLSAQDIVLDGWKLVDNNGDELALSGTASASSDYYACANMDAGTNGGVNCDFEFPPSFALVNEPGEVSLVAPDGAVVVLLQWTTSTDDEVVSNTGTLEGVLGTTGGDKVDICHSDQEDADLPTSADSPNINAIVGESGHSIHAIDIIPPFFYDAGDGVEYFSGLNWNEENEAFLEAGCTDGSEGEGEGEDPTETSETIVVSGDTSAGENQPGWLFNRDVKTATPFSFDDDASQIGDGALHVLPIANDYDGVFGDCKGGVDQTGCNKFIAEYFPDTLMGDLESFSYDFNIGSGGDASDENEFYLNVYANFGDSASPTTNFYDCRYNVVPTTGVVGSWTTVTFDPDETYPVAKWGESGSEHACPASPGDMGDDAVIRAFAINLGDTSNNDTGLDGYFDNVVKVVNEESNTHTTTYDFEPEALQCGAPDGDWAYNVESFAQGTKKGGDTIAAGRSNPDVALGEPDWTPGSPTGFVSLGMGSEPGVAQIVLAFENFVPNVDGIDLSIYEATNGTFPTETALVEIAQHGDGWYEVGTATSGGVSHFDIDSTPLSWFKYVRITDTTDPSLHTDDGDGFDLDAVGVAQTVCEMPEPEQDQTATVTMCKVGDAEQELNGWTLNLLGEPVETVTVPTNGDIVSSSANLDGPYVFLASGLYTYRAGGESVADAVFSRRLESGDPIPPTGPHAPWVHMNALPGGYIGMLGITIDAMVGATNWTSVFNPLHTYGMQYIGDGDQATFQAIDSHYNDNEGTLSVEIYEGYSGVTEGNGCFVIEDVPFGTYTVDEVMQEGWWNLSGLGEITIDQDEVEITVVNTQTEPVIEASLVITNPEEDGQTLEGTHTFEAEYIDDDETVDTILWAIREGTCAAGTNTVAGNVDGFSDGSTFVGDLFSAMVDMSTWEDGEYCFVVNPQEGGGTDFRETRTFFLNNEEKEEPVACVPDLNLLANASFEDPVGDEDKKWSLINNPLGWVVEKVSDATSTMLEFHYGVNGWTSSDGDQHVELDGNESTQISQVIPTVLGETYRLSWDFAARPDTFETNNILKVIVDGVELAENKANGGSTLVWTSDSVEFEGTGSDVEIMFADDGDSDSLGTFLDNTSLVCNPAPEVGPYCGDGEVNQEWETCDGGESCTNYCLADNMCHDVRLAKIDLGTSASQSVSFDGMIYLGTSTNPIPSNTWFNLDEVGDSLANLIAEDVDGLAVERNHTGSTTLRLAFRGDNKSGDIDIVKGNIQFLGAKSWSGSVLRSIMGAASYKLENEAPAFIDIFDVASGGKSITFDMRADTGNDGVTTSIRDGDEYGAEVCPIPGGGGDGEGDDEDLYEIFGYVWNDEDEDGEWDTSPEEAEALSDEEARAGVLVTISNDDGVFATTTTDESGYYSFLVPEGTWTITEDPGDEWDHTTDDSIVVTVPTPDESASVFQTIFNFFIPTAHAATFEDYSGPHNFGNVFVGSPVVSLTGGGGGTYISLSANSNNDDDVPEGQVLGAQTSVIPAGAPNAGFGGTSTHVSFTMTLMQVLSVLLAVAAFARFSSHAK